MDTDNPDTSESWLPEPARLLALVAEEGRPVDLSSVTVHDNGWENLVLETSDGWILRFPRTQSLPFDRELTLLQEIGARVSVAIPRVAWTGRRTRYMAYRTLTGDVFEGDDYLRAPSSKRDDLALSLAQFLAEMHAAISPADAEELGVARADRTPQLDFVTRHIDHVPRQHRGAVELVLEQWPQSWMTGEPQEPPVLLHNDFHTGNMVFADGRLSGIWDFSCVEIGPPSLDVRYLDGPPRDLLDRVVEAYDRLTGRHLNVAAAVLANRLEDVFDALDTGRLELLDRAARRWARADAGR